MISRLSDSRLLQPSDIQPSQSDWEVIGVFNPAVAIVDTELVMLARVAERPSEKRAGWTALPCWTDDQQTEVEWFRNEELRNVDARVVKIKQSGHLRLTSVSHFQVFRQSTSNQPWEYVASLLPEGAWEEYGIEDPRITKIDETYRITYVAVSRSGAATALMSSTDLVAFERQGIIFASENKDVVLFPQRIAGDYVSLHRPNPSSHFSPPKIWLARSPDLIHWGRHEPVFGGVNLWESDRVGSGTPPILINDGWLTLYHGSAKSKIAGTVGCYAAGALLLDRNDPSLVLAHSTEPIMLPMTGYEKNGFVPNIIFPTAMLDVEDEWHVYYGAADSSVAMARLSKRSILDSLHSTQDTQS